jgi:PPOX class probable F420-dependent enzyme
MPAIPDSHRSLLDAPVGELATIGPDGLPQVTALWFLFDPGEGLVRFSLNTARQKVKNLSARPVASFLVLDPASPYRTLELRGRVEIQPDVGGGWTNRYTTEASVRFRAAAPSSGHLRSHWCGPLKQRPRRS